MNPNTSTTFNNNNADGGLVSLDKLDKKSALKIINYLYKYITEENNEKKPEEDNVKSLNDQDSHNKLMESFNSLLAEKQNLEVKCKELEKINSNLKKRVSKYQSALGETKNFRFDDNDKNNSVQLKNDILNLQDALEFYVTNLRPDIDINYKNVNNLLSKYKSKTRISARHTDIPLIKAVLQRHVIETIFGYVSVFTTHKSFDKPYSLEALISNKAEELISLTQEFGMTREGNDSITPTVPVKIRQQIYSSLGNRGLSNVTIGQKTYEHAFICDFKTKLNEEMELYRKILNTTKKSEIEEKAANIILDVIRIFFFRILTQEPIGQIHWFQNKDKIDSSLMICTWDDDKFDDLEVDICIFPLIGTELNNNSNRKVYTHAIIYPREVDSLQGNLEINSRSKSVNSQSQSEQSKLEQSKCEVNYQSQSEQSDINSQSQSQSSPEENEENSRPQSNLETNSQLQSNHEVNSQMQSQSSPEENEKNSQSQSNLETNSQSQFNHEVNSQSRSQSSSEENYSLQGNLETNSQSRSNLRVNSQSQSQSSPEENEEISQSQSNLETNSQLQSNHEVNSQSQSRSQSSPEENKGNSQSQSSLETNSQSQSQSNLGVNSQSQSSPEENKENSQSQSSLETNSQSQSNLGVNSQSQSQSSPEENEEIPQSQSNLETNSQLQSNHEVNSQSQSQSQSSPEENKENSQSQSSLETNSQSQSNLGVNSQSQSQSNLETSSQSQPQPNLETNSQLQSNQEVNSQSQSSLDIKSQSKFNPEVNPQFHSQSNHEANSQSQSQSNPNDQKNEGIKKN
ncbi:unnamed protein product [Rhizophagus irregularis]|nr:unnamed protein product [Rhizophagus irregularis]